MRWAAFTSVAAAHRRVKPARTMPHGPARWRHAAVANPARADPHDSP